MDALRASLARPAVALTLAAALCAPLRADSSKPNSADDHDAHTLILLAPAHPVFIEVRTHVDGQGLKSVRNAYAEQLVGKFDSDGDGLLDREEAKAMPPLVKSASTNEMVAIADRWEAVDVSPADDKVSVAELGAYIDRVFGSTFLLSARPQRATQSVDLFSLIDLNHDGKVSQSEFEAAPRTLRKLDLDDDETFTIDELQPYRNPQLAQGPMAAGAEAADQPFLLLDDDESFARAAEQLLQRYGAARAGSSTGDLCLSREALAADPARFAAADADRDGLLDKTELAAFLREAAPHLVVDAQFHQAKVGKRQLTIVEDHLGQDSPGRRGTPNKLTFSANGIDLELNIPFTQSARADANYNRKFYQTRFLQADQDKNKYLSEQEFGAIGIANMDFKQVDRDGNGMVTLEELLAHAEQERTSSQSRVELVVTNDGKSLFEVIDANKDRRISRRELAHAFEALRQFDRDGDGCVTAGELAGRFKAALELGRPELFRRSTMAMARGDATAPIASLPSSGPEWFRKMDRNRDGDVSIREFLGPPAAFKKLDTDGDGLITLQEAEAAEPR